MTNNERRFKCKWPGCSYSAKFKQHLNYHTLKHTKQRDFPCTSEECEYKAKRPWELRKHMQIHEQVRDRPFKCPQLHCSYASTDRQYLVNHLNTVHSKLDSDSKKFKCSHPNCNYSSFTKYSLRLHAPIYTPASQKLYECAICQKKYASEQQRKSHIFTSHDPKSKTKLCGAPSCGCRSTMELRRHNILAHKMEKELKCPLADCGYRANFQKLLDAHISMKHTGERNFECPVSGCSYRGATSHLLKNHTWAMHNEMSRVKRFKCPAPSCGYKGRTRSIIRLHETSCHNSERPFKCPEPNCEYSAKTRNYLKVHMKVHGQRKKCPIPLCSFSCVQGGDMSAHLRRHRGEKPYECSLCDYAGVTLTLLKNHMSSKHTREMAYKCGEKGCNYVARQLTDMTVHKRRWHTGEKPYKCQRVNCPYAFVCSSDLRYHMKSHEMEENQTLQYRLWRCPALFCRFRIKRLELLARHLSDVHQLPVVRVKRF